jgi:hypothetical protein
MLNNVRGSHADDESLIQCLKGIGADMSLESHTFDWN